MVLYFLRSTFLNVRRLMCMKSFFFACVIVFVQALKLFAQTAALWRQSFVLNIVSKLLEAPTWDSGRIAFENHKT